MHESNIKKNREGQLEKAMTSEWARYQARWLTTPSWCGGGWLAACRRKFCTKETDFSLFFFFNQLRRKCTLERKGDERGARGDCGFSSSEEGCGESIGLTFRFWPSFVWRAYRIPHALHNLGACGAVSFFYIKRWLGCGSPIGRSPNPEMVLGATNGNRKLVDNSPRT
jgi:hypothetical protein